MSIRGDEGASGAEGLEVVLVGLGEQGLAVARAVSARDDLVIAAAYDDSLEGQSLRSLAGSAAVPDMKVASLGSTGLEPGIGDIAIITGCSGRLADCAPTLKGAAAAGMHVVSTCAELAYPFASSPDLAEDLNSAFADKGRCCLGAGFHPGFILDRLPVFIGGMLGEIRHLRARFHRDLDRASEETLELCGIGMLPEEVDERPGEETMGPPGLVESALILIEGLGLAGGELDLEVEAIVADDDLKIGDLRISAGRVGGLRQQVRVFSEGREVVSLVQDFGPRTTEACYELRVDSSPAIQLSISEPIDERAAEAWTIVNACALLPLSEPGLITVLDLPSGRRFSNEQ